MTKPFAIKALFLSEHQAHPEMQPVDYLKLLHQCACGPGHLIDDPSAAKERLLDEYQNAEAGGTRPLFEACSPRFCRLNLGSAKKRGLDAELLFSLFSFSAKEQERDLPLIEQGLKALLALCFELSLEPAELARACTEWEEAGFPPLRHSERYRQVYKPCYRVVSSRFIPLMALLQTLAKRLAQKPVLKLAIEGGCGSGKSTLAALLEGVFSASVFHTDDYFLPFDMRGEERLSTPGGNVHYERLSAELTQKIDGTRLTFRRYDCSSGELSKTAAKELKPLRIIEGVYSMHPYLSQWYDLSVFLKPPLTVRLQRLERRVGHEMMPTFTGKWMPLEDRYFAALDIERTADIVISDW